MTLELIPVIEIGYNNMGLPVPDLWPYWHYPERWDKYNSDNYKLAGFPDYLKPYLPGSSFYRLADISNENLVKVTKDHTEEMRLGKYNRDQVSPFFGGYVLRIDNQDKYFPQCCGDLSDLQYWEQLITHQTKTFYQGHPEPQIRFNNDVITLDFTIGEFDEHFAPPPPENVIHFDVSSLKRAIELVKYELQDFSYKLQQINLEENLHIEDIDKLLVWGDGLRS